MACLSSRIPTGLEVTEERLTRVERAEALLRQWGFDQFRVRDHDGLARIEVSPEELERALTLEFAETVREELSELGFDHVTLDLHGYRTGSVSPESETGLESDGDDRASGTRDGDDPAGSDDPLVEDVFAADSRSRSDD